MNPAKKEAMQTILNGTKLLLHQIRHDFELLEVFDRSFPSGKARHDLSELLADVYFLRDFVDGL